MGRRNRRSEAAEFELYSEPSGLGVRFLRRISAEAGDALCKEGKAKLVFFEETGQYVFQMTEQRHDAAPADVANESCTVLSKSEVNAIIGQFGESRTAGLSKPQRAVLEALKQETHDFVERAHVKLSAFDPRHGRHVITV